MYKNYDLDYLSDNVLFNIIMNLAYEITVVSYVYTHLPSQSF